ALPSCKAPNGNDLFKPIPSTAVGTLGEAGAGGMLPLVPLDMESSDAGTPALSPSSSSRLDAGIAPPLPPMAQASTDASVGQANDASTGSIEAGPPACVPHLEVCNGLDDDCDGQVDEEGACAEDCQGFALKGRGYMYCAVELNQATALARCSAQGMRLAWIETAEENAQIVANIVAAPLPRPDDDAELLTFIGGSDAVSEGVWRWVGTESIPDGAQFWQGTSADTGGQAIGGAFANWAPSEPNDTDGNEDCAAVSAIGANNREPGNWDDRSCDTELPFVCEVP
ncbi:MAG TPA: C-type lectin domain-containing protein, partial [Polyangiaceae bacterium]|nr:C-type lectin domain-containing protein [Polyangiaceae bacterium]